MATDAASEVSASYSLNSYQVEAERTLVPHRRLTPENLAIVCLGLTGEAGEVADLAKKLLGHKHPFDRAKFKEELGDVLWYVAAVCSLLDMSLEEVAKGNIDKLHKRYPHGFEAQRSIHRDQTP